MDSFTKDCLNTLGDRVRFLEERLNGLEGALDSLSLYVEELGAKGQDRAVAEHYDEEEAYLNLGRAVSAILLKKGGA